MTSCLAGPQVCLASFELVSEFKVPQFLSLSYVESGRVPVSFSFTRTSMNFSKRRIAWAGSCVRSSRSLMFRRFEILDNLEASSFFWASKSRFELNSEIRIFKKVGFDQKPHRVGIGKHLIRKPKLPPSFRKIDQQISTSKFETTGP